MIQKRAQCWEELSPCPHATQGGGLDLGQAMSQERRKTPDGLSDRAPVGCVRNCLSLNTMKGSRIYIVLVTAFFAGWGKAEPEWIQAGAYSTELARLFSLERAC